MVTAGLTEFTSAISLPTNLPALRQRLISLAFPVFLEQILALCVGFSDRVLTGHYLATEHLAAITVVGYLLWLIYGIFSIVSLGASPLIARAIGAGDVREANVIYHQSLVLGILFALPLTSGAGIGCEYLVGLVRLEGAAAEAAVTYLRWIIPVLPLMMFQAASVGALRACGDMLSGFWVMGVVNATNVLLSWGLVLGVGPLPRLGWSGLAVGTSAGFVVGSFVTGFFLLSGRRPLKLQVSLLRLNWGHIKRILRIGVPGCADNLTVIGCQLWFLGLINCLGAEATAAHGVAISAESFVFLPGVALQAAAATLVGQYLGARQENWALQSVRTASWLGCIAMGLGGGLLIGLAHWLPYAFVSARQTAVASAATPLLRVVGGAMPALALTMILSGALRGAGDTRASLLISVIGFLAVRIPATYALAFGEVVLPFSLGSLRGANLGVVGAWWAMAADLWLRALLLILRFRRGRCLRHEL